MCQARGILVLKHLVLDWGLRQQRQDRAHILLRLAVTCGIPMPSFISALIQAHASAPCSGYRE